MTDLAAVLEQCTIYIPTYKHLTNTKEGFTNFQEIPEKGNKEGSKKEVVYFLIFLLVFFVTWLSIFIPECSSFFAAL